MKKGFDRDISKVFRNGQVIDDALRRAVKEALKKHKLAGNPVAIWQNGKTVWVQPDQIPCE